MPGLTSPDLAAYCCYAIVLGVGLLVARGRVNERLGLYQDRWAFFATWLILLAYVLVPVVLFWFLDYTNVIKDTALFAALVVAVGYRQVFAGKVENIALPPQAPRLWQPFERWVERIADRIETKNKAYRDRFDESVRLHLRLDPKRMKDFQQLVLSYSDDPQALETKIEPFTADPPPPGADRKVVRLLWTDFRESRPEDFGCLLRRRGLIMRGKYWAWQKAARAKFVSWGVALLAVVVVVVLIIYYKDPPRREVWELPYHQWRFMKVNASTHDRYRAREYLGGLLRNLNVDDQRNRESARVALAPLIAAIRFEDIPTRQADDVLRLIVDFRTPATNAVAIPRLIASLRAENADVRLRIQRTLVDLQVADYPGSLEEDARLTQWTPNASDSAGRIDEYVRAWQKWWDKLAAP